MTSSKKNVIVTGGAGFIGSALIRHLVIDREWTVTNVDKLTYAANLASLVSVADNPRYRFVQADVCDRAAMDEVVGTTKPDAIMHLAAESHVDRSISGPAEFIQTNIVGTYTLLEAARSYWDGLAEPQRARFRFLHVSTDEVYGSLAPGAFFHETTPYDPRSPYSASKAASDHLVSAWAATYGLPAIITNCSNNYGPYHFPEKLIPLVLLNALEGRPLPVYGDGRQERDWLYVDDHARALTLAVERGRVGETYNIGGRAPLANLTVVEHLCDILDELRPGPTPRRQLITFVTDRPGHDRRYAIDPAKIEGELGWRAQETFETGLIKTVRWYLDNESWWGPLRKGVYGGQRLGLVHKAGRAMSPAGVLIIGKHGQVARALSARLPGHGFRCTSAARPEIDLTRPHSLENVISVTRPAVVVNAAAYTAVDRAEDEPDLAFAINAEAPGAIAKMAASVGAVIIHISTDYVFDGSKTMPYTETDPVAPLGVYGRSKLAGEHAVASANPRHVILRTAWVCSPYGGNFVKTMLRLATERAELRVVDDQTGSPTFADDIANAIGHIAQQTTAGPAGPSHFGVFNLASAGETTWYGFARAIMDGAALRGVPHVPVVPISTADFPTKAKRPAYSKLDTRKLEAVYGLRLPEWQMSLSPCLDALTGHKSQTS